MSAGPQRLADDWAHELGDRVWAAKLDAIDARVRGIERILLEIRLPLNEQPGPIRWRVTRHDLGVINDSAAVTSAAWWAAEVFRAASGG